MASVASRMRASGGVPDRILMAAPLGV